MGENGTDGRSRIPHGEVLRVEELVCAYSDQLVRFAYGYVKDSSAAEDAVEDAIATLIFKKKKFNDPEHQRAWLYRTTRSRCVDHLRAHRRETPVADVENVLTTGSLWDDTQRKLRDNALYMCLQSLPGQYREVLQLIYFDGFSMAQVGSILNKSAKQVYNLHTRAKSALKALLEKEGITHEDI